MHCIYRGQSVFYDIQTSGVRKKAKYVIHIIP